MHNDNPSSIDGDKKTVDAQLPKAIVPNPTLGILPRRTCVWVDDDSVDECYQCHSSFSWKLRRHHCRGCGRIFCYACSQYVIESTNLNDAGLVDMEKCLYDRLLNESQFIRHRACKECMQIFSRIKELASLVIILELLPVEIISYYNFRRVSKIWQEACNLILSRFREIQYSLPSHKITKFERNMLINNLHLIIGHNKLIRQFIKSFDWDRIDADEFDYILGLIQSNQQTCPCWMLMCCGECQKQMTDCDVIDILLHVKNPRIREIVIQYLTQDNGIIECYIPILTYTIRMDDESHRKKLPYRAIRDHLIDLSIESKYIRYKFFWELLVQLEEPQYNFIYRDTMELFQQKIQFFCESGEIDNINNGMKLVNIISQLSMSATDFGQSLPEKLIANNIYDKEIPLPVKPDNILMGIDHKNVKIMKSSTCPVWIPCHIKDQARTYSFIHKSDDVRKDYIIMCIIKVMDDILKKNGLDMNIVTYNILPTTMTSGLIEIVPDSETLNNITINQKYTIQNYILENNAGGVIDQVRDRFTKSTAAYCVITYLLGIGDRNLDNVMITKDGRLFHIDYSFVLGLDPKPLAPKMRITSEMVDALGGTSSEQYRTFESHCTSCYNILRKDANLFTNMLFLLTKMERSKFTPEQLNIEIGKRFLPGEYKSQAKIQLLKTINSSKNTSQVFGDYIHQQYKNLDSWGSYNLYEKASNLTSSIKSTVSSTVTANIMSYWNSFGKPSPAPVIVATEKPQETPKTETNDSLIETKDNKKNRMSTGITPKATSFDENVEINPQKI